MLKEVVRYQFVSNSTAFTRGTVLDGHWGGGGGCGKSKFIYLNFLTPGTAFIS